MHSESTIRQPERFAVIETNSSRAGNLRLVFGHGWGQSSAAFLPIAETLKPFAPSYLIDFPGFGKSPVPPQTWGTAEYADAVADWLTSLAPERFLWIGHSFGGRIGLQLASRRPELLKGMILIASAGLPRARTLLEQARISIRRAFFKTAKHLLKEGPQLERLRSRMGSADYRAAGPLRPILSRVVSENLSDAAAAVSCPTLLLYGSEDTDTPPEIGERLHKLIPGSELSVLQGLGHIDILTRGQHQLALRIRKFIEAHA
ncbi:MAG: alpha/beta fold hydrolase [Bryobacteraceae bacterium]